MRWWITSLIVMVAVGFWTVFSSAQAQPQAKTLEGELLDMYCYSAGGASGEKHAGCGKKCLASGIPAGILVGEEAYTLATNPAPLADHVGKQIRVSGDVNEKTRIMLPEKVEVQADGEWKEVELKDEHHK